MLNNEKELLDRIIQGESHLYSHVMEHYAQAVYALVIRIVGSAEDSEELAQDIFIKAFEQLQFFRGRSSFSTWLYRIAYNAAISHARRRKQKLIEIDERRLQAVEDSAIEQMEQGTTGHSIAELQRAIEKLDIEERALITFFYYEDKSIAECATILGYSESNVKVRLHRIRKKLYILLTQHSDERE